MLSGGVLLEWTSADLSGAMDAGAQAGITLIDVLPVDDLTVRLTVMRSELDQLERLAKKRGDRLRRIGRTGAYWRMVRIGAHPILLVGILVILAATILLPMMVLFVNVEGNVTVPDRIILEKAGECGIRFGAARGEIRSEKLKNALLEAVPELQWAGINTSGCVATVTVRERSREEADAPIVGIASIVARRDGVVRSCTVSRGTAVCKVGQVVRAGEILISGYTNCGIAILSSVAQGEVFADTNRDLLVVTVPNGVARQEETGREIKFSLLLGKNRINFCEDSGILDATCVKMITEYHLTLPGGFRLPVTLLREEWISYAWEESETQNGEQTLLDFAETYLSEQMIAGEILSRNEIISDGILYGNYICLEMIGQIKYEEIIDEYGKNYGENSQRGTG